MYCFFKKFNCLFIYSWVCWVFVSVRGLSLVVASGGHSPSRCADLSLSRPLLLRSTGSRRAGSVVVAHWPSCSAARGIFPDQGSNPCPLHWQADSQPLRHQGSSIVLLLWTSIIGLCRLLLLTAHRPSCLLVEPEAVTFTASQQCDCLSFPGVRPSLHACHAEGHLESWRPPLPNADELS